MTLPFAHYVSDLHLEMQNSVADVIRRIIRDKHPSADYLFICGDLGYIHDPKYALFLEFMSQFFKHVFVCHGNHEFYNLKNASLENVRTVEEMIAQIQLLCTRWNNVHYLHNQTFDLFDERLKKTIRIIGTALFYHTPRIHADTVESTMNDFQCIYTKDANSLVVRKINHHDVNVWHEEAVQFLRKSLEECQKEQIPNIIMTHHLMALQMLSREKLSRGFPYNTPYASDYAKEFLSAKNCTLAYLCGHSHEPNQKEINGIACFMNPYGYPGELDTKRTFSQTFSIK